MKTINHSEQNQQSVYPHLSPVSKILLVDDEFLLQRINKSLLEDLGYSVVVATNGKEAIQFFEHNHCDLVLMDVHMPIMKGYEAADYLRHSMQVNIPIIAFTTDMSEETKTACLKAGMNTVAEKPMKVNELQSLLEKFIH